MTKCENCWWYGKPIECNEFDLELYIDNKVYECRNFKAKGDGVCGKNRTLHNARIGTLFNHEI